MTIRAYELKCHACGFTRQHEGRPPLLCSQCGQRRTKPDYQVPVMATEPLPPEEIGIGHTNPDNGPEAA